MDLILCINELIFIDMDLIICINELIFIDMDLILCINELIFIDIMSLTRFCAQNLIYLYRGSMGFL